MNKIYLFVMSIFLCGSIFSQEIQIPFYPESSINIITKSQARKFSIFSNYDNFIEAKLFEIRPGKFAVEIFYEKNDTVYKDRKVLTEIEKTKYLAELIKKASETALVSVNEKGENVLLDQKGRPVMLTTSSLVGLAYYGWAFPMIFNPNTFKVELAMYMFAGGASFYVPYKLTENKNVSLAQASMMFYGQTRGIMHGMMLGEILAEDIDYEYYGDYQNWDSINRVQEKIRDKRNTILFGFGVGTSLAEGIAGYLMAEKWNYTGGSSSMFQMGGDIGTVAGFLASDLFDFYQRDNMNAVFGTVITTSALGMTAGKFLADTRNYTLGDAIVYRGTIALGAAIPQFIVNYFEPEKSEYYTGTAIIGGLAGGYLGYRLLENKDFSVGNGVMVVLGELAGGLLGLGTGYLIDEDNNNAKLMLTTATLGAVAGYGFMYKTFKNKSLVSSNNLKIDMGFNPVSLINTNNKSSNNSYVEGNLVSLKLSF